MIKEPIPVPIPPVRMAVPFLNPMDDGGSSGPGPGNQVDLAIDGRSETEENDPGGFVRIGGARRKITLECTAASGNVTLSRSPSSPNHKVRVYTAETGGTEITFNGTDNKFPVADLPKDLYVSGYSLSSHEMDVTLTLAHDGGGGSDDVKFTVVQINLYRDSGYTQSLTDWPETSPGANDRSAMYIFGKSDPIYVEVRGLGTDPNTQEWIFQCIQVTSDSDASGVYLSMDETGLDTAVFRAGAGEQLYLSTSSSEGAGDKIKVIDEEVLTFKLMKDPYCYIDVMVDRGEFAACGLSFVDYCVDKFRDEMEASRVNWWQAGYQEFPDTVGGPGNAMKTFIENAGDNDANHGEADFLYYICHGSDDGSLWDNDFPNVEIMRPSDINTASDWNNDVEWVWAHACYTLNVAGGGRNAWDNALFGSSRPAHMILGNHDIAHADAEIIDDFFDHAADSSPDTIVSSYYHAGTDWTRDEPVAIVEHLDNDGDYLKVVTRDTDSTSMRYYWYNTSTNDWSSSNYTA